MKRREARQLAEAYQKLQQYSWNLLYSAMKGQVDDEALTMLQTAWREPKIEDLFKKETALPAFRALWVLSEAARALPDNKDIQSLSQTAIKRCGPKLADASAQLLAQPDDMNQYLPVLYGTLTVRDQLKVAGVSDQAFQQAVSLLKRERSGLPLRDMRLCSMILLESEPNPAMAEALIGRLGEGSRGEDLTVLIALAARKSGGKVWQQYRQQSVDILSRQQLPGSVVVLVHNLAGHPLPVTVAKK